MSLAPRHTTTIAQVMQVTQVAGECVHDCTRIACITCITCIKCITKHQERHHTALHSTTCITPGPCGMLRPVKSASWTEGK